MYHSVRDFFSNNFFFLNTGLLKNIRTCLMKFYYYIVEKRNLDSFKTILAVKMKLLLFAIRAKGLGNSNY